MLIPRFFATTRCLEDLVEIVLGHGDSLAPACARPWTRRQVHRADRVHQGVKPTSPVSIAGYRTGQCRLVSPPIGPSIGRPYRDELWHSEVVVGSAKRLAGQMGSYDDT